MAITTETEQIGSIETGQAVATTAGDLPAAHVIHTAGPIWGEVEPAEADAQLGSCYRNSLDLAVELGASSIAFPNVSTGIYGFPPDRAAKVATAAVSAWLEENPGALDSVEFVCFDEANYRPYADLLGL